MAGMNCSICGGDQFREQRVFLPELIAQWQLSECDSSMLTASAELDLKQAVWSVPGDQMKMGIEHRVPLPSKAVELLKAAQAQAQAQAQQANCTFRVGGALGAGQSRLQRAVCERPL